MEACLLFDRSTEARVITSYEEQEEDIGSESDDSSRNSAGSSSSPSDLADDASSSSSEHFEMSSLMTQLPIKRGLSRFYDGKSQSFASLAAMDSLEVLAKPPPKRLKPSRSCGVGLGAHRLRFLPPPPRHCPSGAAAAGKKAARSPLSVLGAAAPRRRTRLPVAAPARPEGLAGQALLFA